MSNKANISRYKSKTQLPLNAAVKCMKALHEQGRYQDALDICLQITHEHPQIPGGWSDAAINCAYLQRWQDTIRYGQTALARGGGTHQALHDALAHAHGKLGQWDEVRRHGLQALGIRARQFDSEPAIPLPTLGPMPPPPNAQTRERNVIAFSLFGGDSKYCETAVLNAQEQPQVYPHWVCRFYVDGSVPDHVIDRLRAGDAQIVRVEGYPAQWPGPMWRLLALDDPQAHRILFRDADSVISQREAAAVEQWIASGKRFHMMRDAPSHTELMLAGMWGVVAGSLPPLEKLMQRFMGKPLESRRFADQYFLRQYVWPYARASLMQHDSVFGFMDAVPFPDEERLEGFRVGDSEGAASLTTKIDLPDGAKVAWELHLIEKFDEGQTREKLVCAYTSTVQNSAVTVHIPERYLHRVRQGTACVHLFKNGVAPGANSAPPPHPLRATETSTPRHQSETPLPVDAAVKHMAALREQGRYQEALDICLQVAHAHPDLAVAWSDAALNCAWLRRWQDAIRYAQTALACGGENNVGIYDTLAYAHSALKQWVEARRYGLQALNMRDRRFGGEPAIPLPELGPMPPSPSAQTREHNVIVFSLFGGNSKYCEAAVLNVQEQPRIYPHWVCRFYVDGSVPEHVIARLRAGGGQVVQVSGAQAQWPGPMWRLLALDDPQAHRILFRNADSVISRREAAAVEQWVASGKRFHMMRDDAAHTELMLAGLWGVVAGSLPPLEKLMERFMSAPLASSRRANQEFLRQYVWPYARTSLMQHDSVFGFMDAMPFPDGEKPEGFCVGESEGSASLTAEINLPDGSEVVWELYLIEKRNDGQPQEERICAYPASVRDGAIKVHVPLRYVRRLQQGMAGLRLVRGDAA